MPQTASFNNQELLPLYNYRNARKRGIRLAPNLNLPKGRLLGELAAQRGTYAAYNDANADGTEVARCVLPRAVVTDANGVPSWGQSPVGAAESQSVDAYFSGVFDTKELVGLDAAAVVDLGRISQGTIADGELEILGN